MLLSATQKDVDDYFQKEKVFLLEYHAAIKDTTIKADKMTRAHKSKSNNEVNVSQCTNYIFIFIFIY